MSRPWRRGLAATCVLALHFTIVFSIAAQPLRVNSAPPEQRSWIWPLHNDTVHRAGPGADFFAVYHAGLALSAGIDPYGARRLEGVPYYYPFRYLPVVASTLGRLSTLVAPRTAWLAWLAVLELLLAVITATLCARTEDARLRAALFALLYLQSPFFLELHMGQFTFAALSLLMLASLWADDPPARERAQQALRRIGIGASFLTSFALKPIGLVAAPAFARRRGDAATLALAAIAVLAISARYFVVHPNQWPGFAALNLGNPTGYMDSGNYGFTHLVVLALQDLGWIQGRSPSDVFLVAWRYGWLALAAALVLTSRSSDVTLGTCALVIAHYLGFAQIWEHHVSGLVVIGAALVVALARQPAGAGRRDIAFALLALVWLALPTPFAWFDTGHDPHVYHPSDGWPRYALYLCVASKALPTLLLFAVASQALWLRTSRSTTRVTATELACR